MADFPNVLVVMAVPAESAGVFEAAGVPVLYCGVGKINAAVALTRELRRYVHHARPLPLVLNVGTAGSPAYATGSLLECHEFMQRDMDVGGLGFALGVTPFDEVPPRLSFERRFPRLTAAVCGSGDSFVTSLSSADWAVVDMEAYALAKVCWIEKAPFACVKYVTDGADHAAAHHWQSNVHKAAEEFLSLYRSVRQASGAA
ncbi:MAG: 5'-nucleosidase [Steroidobacteraceae bacterium]